MVKEVVLEILACIDNSKYIRTCYGKGHTNISVKENINIPKGVDDSMNLRVAKKV